MRAPNADETHLLVCEDVRQEGDGRLSLMGLFGPSISIPEVPTVLPSLCCVVLLLSPKEHFRVIGFSLVRPDGTPLVSQSSEVAETAEEPPFQSQHIFKVYPAPLQIEGPYEFRVTFGDPTEGIEMRRTIIVRRSPTESLPHPAAH